MLGDDALVSLVVRDLTGMRPCAGEVLFALITYEFPVLSAKAVPDLQNFLKQWVTNQ